MFEAEPAHHQPVRLHPQPQRQAPRRWWVGGLLLGLLTLSSCANTPWGAQMQQSLEADPRLQNDTTLGGSNTGASADLPAEIPIYPEAEQQEAPADVKANADEQYGRLTYFTTADSADQVEQFYRDELSSNGWQIESEEAAEETAPNSGAAENSGTSSAASDASNTANLQPLGSAQSGNTANESQNAASAPESSEATDETEAADAQADQPTAIAARKQDLTVRVAIQPDATNSEETAFTIQYQRDSQATDGAASDDAEGFSIRPVNPSEQDRSTANLQNQDSTNTGTFADLNQAPTDLRPYIRDLAGLEIVTAAPAADKEGEDQPAANQFQPNQPITRREFARWLVEANNTIYADEAKERIRLAIESSNPAFEDVPKSDPDFAVIQGLAEVGLVPSALAGNATTVNFRPDAPLTRQDLLLWKVPLDTRQALPSASVEAVQEAWGFQDASKINPAALRAVLADHQNGDFANIPRAFGYTTLLQPEKAATRAEAAAVLWRIGNQNEGVTAEEVLNRDAQNSNTGT